MVVSDRSIHQQNAGRRVEFFEQFLLVRRELIAAQHLIPVDAREGENGKGRRAHLSSFDTDAATVNRVRADPSIDASAIVADLKPFALNCFDEMKVMIAPNAAKDDISDRQFRRVPDRDHSAELSRFILANHGVAARAKRNRLSIAK